MSEESKKIEPRYCVALRGKANKVQSHDVGELWHRIMGHVHHGSLKIMQQITIGLPKGSLEQQDVYKGCTLEKYVKSTFHDLESRADAILEQVTLMFVDAFLQPP